MSLSERMGRHSVVYGASLIAGQALGFLLIPIYTRAIPPGDYGSLEVLNRTSEVLGILILAGLRMGVIRFVQDPQYASRRREVVGGAMWTLLVPGTVLLGFCLWQAEWVAGLLLRLPQLAWAVRLMAAGSMCELATTIPMALLQADQRANWFAGLSLGRVVLGLALNLALVAAWKLGLKGILLASVLSAGSLAAFLQWRLWRVERPRLEGGVLRELLRFGLPFVPGGLFLFILNNGDRYFLVRLATPAEVGLYALGYRLGTVVLMLVVQPIIMNWSTVMVEINSRPDARAVFRRHFTLVAALYACIATGMSLLCPTLLSFLVGPEYRAAAGLVPWVCLAYFFYMCSMFFDTPFYLSKRTAAKPLLLGVATVANLALYAGLIPRYHMYGAVHATILAFALFAAITWAAARRHLDIPYDWARLATVVLGGSAVVAAGLGLPAPVPVLTVALRLALALAFPLCVWGWVLSSEDRAVVIRAGRGILHLPAEASHGT